MTPTDGDLIQLQSQAEFMAMGFGTREWKLMAEAIRELRELRKKADELAEWQRWTQGHVWIRNEEYAELCRLKEVHGPRPLEAAIDG